VALGGAGDVVQVLLDLVDLLPLRGLCGVKVEHGTDPGGHHHGGERELRGLPPSGAAGLADGGPSPRLGGFHGQGFVELRDWGSFAQRTNAHEKQRGSGLGVYRPWAPT
jgi:hypothetical protein